LHMYIISVIKSVKTVVALNTCP